MMSEPCHAQGGIAEELSSALQAGAPSFFREDDKTFYRASALLQRAAETFPGPDAGQLASQVRILAATLSERRFGHGRKLCKHVQLRSMACTCNSVNARTTA